MKSVTESPLVFPCGADTLLGIVSLPGDGQGSTANTAVLIIVGGPQYRAGSHRQFVQMARALAAAGYPAMRFDYRGMGDSTGTLHDFEHVAEDIAAAIGALCERLSEVRRVVLWGLCDGASAALLYLHDRNDPRVAGLCLLNPWARSATMLARTHVKHYYLQRVLQPAFWSKLLSGEVAGKALRDLRDNLRLAWQPSTAKTWGTGATPLSYQDRMADGWRGFSGPILLVLSEVDYTAKEFFEHASSHPRWKGCLDLPAVRRVVVRGADHTFSELTTQSAVEQLTLRWMAELPVAVGAPA